MVRMLAQPYWAHDLGGAGNAHIADIQVDVDGSIYVTGEYGGTGSFMGTNMPNSGGTDAFVARVAANGTLQWLVRGGGAGMDRGLKLAVGTTGLAVTGEFMGAAQLFGSELNSAGGTTDMFVALLDKADGNAQWVRQGGGATGADRPGGVSIAANGRVAVAGEFRGTAQWEGSTLTSMNDAGTGQPSLDVFVASYSATGDLLWLKHGAASADDRAVDVVHDAAGNLYVTGVFSHAITFGQVYANVLLNACFLIRLDADGNDSWFRRFGGATFNHVRDLVMDGTRVLVLGDVQGGMTWAGPPNATVGGGQPYGYFILAVGGDGALQDHVFVGSANGVTSRGLAIGGGEVAVLGGFNCRFTGLAAHYDGDGIFMATGPNDLFLALHTQATLDLLEAQQFGGPAEKVPGGVGLLPGGDPVFSGSYQVRVIFPAGAGFQADLHTASGALVGNGIPSYCSDANYGAFAANNSAGLYDGLLARGYVQGRAPFDWWQRESGPCVRDMRQPCIRSGGPEICPDTVVACGSVVLSVRHFFTPNGISPTPSIGPQLTYLWSNGSTTATTSITTSGTYGVTITTANGCWQWTDSVEVVINPVPPAPLVHDDVVINTGTSVPALIPLCDPETHMAWVTGVSPNHSVSWTPPFGAPVVQGNTVQVDTTGTYTVTVVNEFGCSRSAWLFVQDHPQVPMPDLTMEMEFAFGQDLDLNDTVSLCPSDLLFYEYTLRWSIDGEAVEELPLGLTANWGLLPQEPNLPLTNTLVGGSKPVQASGWVVLDVGIMVTNGPCGLDTLRFQGMDSVYVELYPALSVGADLVGPTAVCDGDTILLTASCTACDTLVWTGLAFNLLDEWTAQVWAPGQYMITATASDTNGCVASDMRVVTVIMPTGPVLQVDPSDGILCPGVQATISTTTTGSAHVWYGPAGPITGQQGTLVTDQPGVYSLAMEVEGCPVTSNSVELENYGTPFFAFADAPVLCFPGDQVVLEVATTNSAVINWAAPLGGSGPSQVITAPGTYSCSVTACGITTPLSVVVPYAPIVAELTTPGPFAVCYRDSMLLQAAPVNGTHLWLPDNVHGPELWVHGSAELVLVVANTEGCSDTTAVITVTGITFPEAITANGDTVCAGDQAVLTASGSGTPVWYADAGFTQTLGQGTPFGLLANEAMVVYVRQEDSGCLGTDTQVDIGVIPRPQAVAISGPDTLCAGDAFNIVVIGPDSLLYAWNGPTGTFTGMDLLVDPVAPANGGLYLCTPYHRGCAGPVATHALVVHQPMVPDLPQWSRLCDGGALTFTLPPGYGDVQWSTGATSMAITVASASELLLTANDINGCPIELAMVVEVDECDLVLPNVFSPPPVPSGRSGHRCWG